MVYVPFKKKIQIPHKTTLFFFFFFFFKSQSNWRGVGWGFGIWSSVPVYGSMKEESGLKKEG